MLLTSITCTIQHRKTQLSQNYYNQDISSSIGYLKPKSYRNYLIRTTKLVNKLQKQYTKGNSSLLNLPGKTRDLEIVEDVAEHFCTNFDDVIVLGTGGSSLGGQAVCQLSSVTTSSVPSLHFMDNIDPHSFDRLFKIIKPERTGFIVISKSGKTAETLTQFLYCWDVFQSAIKRDKKTINLHEHFVVITELGDRPLRRLAIKWRIKTIDYDKDIGGRFSVLSIVGLLPALIAGVDAYQIREGANSVIEQMVSLKNIEKFPPATGAILNILLAKEHNISTTVLMPYLDQLSVFGQWFQQLWAESLGKNGQGTTPVRALGTVDQHSQLQLYLDGPKDKFFTLILADQRDIGGKIPKTLANHRDLKFIAGKRMGDLINAEQLATSASLINNNCPTRILSIKSLDEHSLGALLMHFMLETIIAADLMGVNAFDQPAVEAGKILAKKYISGDMI